MSTNLPTITERSRPSLAVVGGNAIAQLRLHMPAARYHASEGLNISKLKRLARSPLHFAFEPPAPAEGEALPLHLGKAAHCAVLEPERFKHDYVVWDRYSEAGNLCPRKGQYWDAFKAKHAHQEICMPEEYEHAIAMQHAVRSDKDASKYLQRGAAEVSMRWMMHGRLCRGRADWLGMVDKKPHLVGLKTAADARLWQFSGAAARYGYHLQWAWYHDGYEYIRRVKPAMKEIVVESRPPYAVVVYDIPDEVIEEGRYEYERLLELLSDCERAKEWPGPGMGGEVTFSLPAYAMRSSTAGDDITGLELEGLEA